MSTMLIAVVGFALLNYALKAAGPLAMHKRTLPPSVGAIIDALPPALLAGMLVGAVAGPQWSLLDPTLLGGLLAAVLAWAARAGPLAGMLACVITTALLRVWL